MFTELHREEKREEGDRGGQEDKSGESKGERQIPPVISSPPSGTLRNSQSWVEKRRGREEIEATWWIKRRVQRGERSQASNLTPKQKWVLKIGFLKVQN